MSIQKSLKTSQSAQARAKQIKATIRKLKRKIQKIEREGEVAPSSPVKVKLIKAESPAKSSLMNNEKPKVGCPIV